MDKPSPSIAPTASAKPATGPRGEARGEGHASIYETRSPGGNPGQRSPVHRAVRIWLIVGLVMIFFQVIIGGVTRLTGSGLSITEWEIVTGTLPPLNAVHWQEEFVAYQATPQYEKMNEGMSLSDFKFIYFWEYFHRLWARVMGLVFLIPLGYFLFKGWISKRLGKRLGLVFLCAALAASFGWIMVASGLIDRPLVNAYKLSVHLAIAFVTFGVLFWTTLYAYNPQLPAAVPSRQRKLMYFTAGAIVVQILLGGMMSGMKAALFYPSWPDLNGEAIPNVLFDAANWTWANVVHYDSSPFMAALVQVLHRTSAYLVAILVGALAYLGLRQNRSSGRWSGVLWLLVGLTSVQMLLGIITVVLSKSVIPVGWGVLHQAGALFLMAGTLLALWYLRTSSTLRSAAP